MVEIQDDALRRVLAPAFGWNISPQNLLQSSSSDSGEGKEITVVDKELYQRAGRRLVAEEIDSQRNMEDVAERADRILQSDPRQSDSQGKTDQGWIRECLEGAGKAYDDDLKNYWAKLLAGGIRNPGTYSKRAILFMKSLSIEDADKIRRMCQYVVYNYDNTDAVILRYKPSDYTFDEISFLMELRLLNYNHSIVKQYRFDKNDGYGFFRKKDVGLFVKIKRKEYNLPIYSFTELGKEILTIIDDVDVKREYLKDFCRSITGERNSVETVCGDIVEVEDHYQFAENDNYFEIPEKENKITLDARKD